MRLLKSWEKEDHNFDKKKAVAVGENNIDLLVGMLRYACCMSEGYAQSRFRDIYGEVQKVLSYQEKVSQIWEKEGGTASEIDKKVLKQTGYI